MNANARESRQAIAPGIRVYSRSFAVKFPAIPITSWILVAVFQFGPVRDGELILKDEVFAIVGAAIEVTNHLGHGLHEKAYENALVTEFRLRNIPWEQQRRFPVNYKGVLVAEFIPDLIAFGLVVVDTKCVDRLGDQEVGQMLNYLRITGLEVGLLLNFKRSRLEWLRVVKSATDRNWPKNQSPDSKS